MYRIIWTDNREADFFNLQSEVDIAASKIGTDGGVVKWYSEHHATVCYYDEIIAYVTYVEPEPEEKDFHSKFLKGTLDTLTAEGNKRLAIAYDKYVQKMIASKQSEEIKSLLYFMSFMEWLD